MWPFRQVRAVGPAQHPADIEYNDDFLRIRSKDFFGQYSRSPNGRYTVAWSDSDRQRGVGGFRLRGEGEYLLIDGEAVIVSGRLQRPNDGKVGNNGTFIINDWEFGDGLKGTFYAFDCLGSSVLSKHFAANLYNNGLSQNGDLAVCQTAASDCGDGGILTVFDLMHRSAIAQWIPESGWASAYEFDKDRGRIWLVYRGRSYADYPEPKWAYSFEGNFLDRERWILDKLKWGDFTTLIMTVKARVTGNLEPVEVAEARSLLSSLRAALEKGATQYPDWHAEAQKLLGILHERVQEPSEAIKCYEMALELNSKIGVKRRLAALRKEAAGQ
jgi:tetratricopeptide (TPR) repeat protein